MDYISGEEYARAEASNAYSTAKNLERQIEKLTSIISNLQLDVTFLKKKVEELSNKETEKIYLL